MRSRTTARFRELLPTLPEDVRRQADRAYRLWAANPRHPSLRFKRVHAEQAIYAVRVGLHWRALGVLEGDDLIWFWIGSHADYDAMVERLSRR